MVMIEVGAGVGNARDQVKMKMRVARDLSTRKGVYRYTPTNASRVRSRLWSTIGPCLVHVHITGIDGYHVSYLFII